MGCYRARCSREFFHCCHSTCCNPFRWVANKCSDCFCCHWWYFLGIVKVEEDSLRFSTCFARCTSGLHCLVGKIDEAMCSVDDHAIVSDGAQPYNGPRQILHYDVMLCKRTVSNIIFECGCSFWFL